MVGRSRHIEGWFSRDAALLFGLIDEIQRSAGVGGDLFEIGAHHGRSTVLLCAMASPGERVGVCDLFGQQELNISGSGSGDQAMFEANVERVVPGFDRVRVFAKLSSDLSGDEVGSPQRLFHVDGSHLHGEALSDLRLGARVLHPKGALVVDDPFVPEWPGVTEAIFDFLADDKGYTPVFLGFNKLVIVPAESISLYEELLGDDEVLGRYVDRRVYDVKFLPIADRSCRIAHLPVAQRQADFDRAIARLLVLRRNVPYEIRRPRLLYHRVAALAHRRRGPDRSPPEPGL